MTDPTALIASWLAFREMPLEGGCVDPLIDCMHSLADQTTFMLRTLAAERDAALASLAQAEKIITKAYPFGRAPA